MFPTRFAPLCPLVVVVFAGLSAFGDEPPTLTKIRLKSGRAVVGELIEQSPAGIKLRDLKSGKPTDRPQDDLLKVERNVADSDAIGRNRLSALA